MCYVYMAQEPFLFAAKKNGLGRAHRAKKCQGAAGFRVPRVACAGAIWRVIFCAPGLLRGLFGVAGYHCAPICVALPCSSRGFVCKVQPSGRCGVILPATNRPRLSSVIIGVLGFGRFCLRGGYREQK